MLEKIREGSQGVTAKVILGLVILTFALAGVGSYINSTPPPAVAVVNGEEITQAAFDQKYRSARARMEQQFGQMFQTLAADENYMKNFAEGVLDQLIAETLQTQIADNVGMYVSDDSLKESVLNMSEFQVDGKFDNQMYLSVLQRAGYQPKDFFDYLRIENTRRQLAQAIMGTEFSLANEASAYAKLDKQTRDIEYVVFKHEDFKDQVTLTDEEKTAYYEANIDKYQTQERIALQYVEVKMTDLMKDIAVTDELLEQYYNTNIDNYRTNIGRRQVAHILVEFGDDEQAAKTKAQDLLAKAKAGEDFATLVKQNSDDAFTADEGGVLDWVTIGSEGAIEEAAFAIAQVNGYADVVRGEDGFHIIKLLKDEPQTIKTFAEVKTQVAEAYKRSQAIETYEHKVESLRDASYEEPETLQVAADAIETKVQETALFTRMAPPPVVNFPAVMTEAFGTQVMVEKYNSDLIEISDDHVMVVRLLKHEPVRTQTQEEVAEQIKTALITEKSKQMAQDKAAQLLAQVSGDKKLTDEDSAKGLTIVTKAAVSRTTSDVDYALRSEIFKMPRPDAGKVSTKVVEMGSGDQALVAISAVTAGQVPEDIKATEDRLVSQRSQLVYQSFIEGLKEQAKIEKFAAEPSRQF